MKKLFILVLVIILFLMSGCFSRSAFKNIYQPNKDIIKNTEITNTNFLKDSFNLKTSNLLSGLIILGILGVGISIALIYLGNLKIGIASLLSSISVIILTLTISQYIKIIALVGLILICLILLFLIYQAFMSRKTNIELVKTVELVKPLIPKKNKEEIFGITKPRVEKVQSNFTKKIVQEIKKKL